MSTFESIDFFTDPSLVPDPHPYFDYLRSQNPVLRLPHYGVVAITGYDEACEVYKDPETFSNIVALGGPFPPLPFTPEGDDISAQIDAHRSSFRCSSTWSPWIRRTTPRPGRCSPSC